jgi:hypothetical protein
MNMTSNGIQPLNIEIGISQQPFIGSYSNFKLRLWRQKQSVKTLLMKMTSHGRRPQNIERGISQLIGSSQISNLSLYDQIIFCKSFI